MIIVFDSGIGGFSILREIIRENLASSILYLADQKHFPYGDKDSTWLALRLREIALWAKSLSPEAFIVACNTGTVAGIKEVREVLSCPVIGVEPVIKPLASFNRALILSTQTTATSPRTQELLETHGSHIQIYAPKGLALAIENNETTQVKNILQEISALVDREKIEAVGLSCTHYPLVAQELQSACPNVHLYDPSSAVVSQLKKTVKPGSKLALNFQTTGGVVRFNEQLKKYFGGQYQGEYLDL